ncbi:C40 family peptidase [Croceitalea rosinachiae]|uniref:C40 family peptidase n=1 Tax=Croceitalea rosinachiae TaxID=3075596 RepID=A0ABU3A997_9FLAO|nr:C40 family peptidase [Croceitalea sp. F388]MDT0606754.1 C40 family peptidase [Croceitalea sp. F388]
MLKKAYILIIAILLTGCFAKKKTTYSKTRTITVKSSDEKHVTTKEKKKKKGGENKKAEQVIETAMTYSGVRYKFGGETKKGMDCSGLVFVALTKNDISFPRISHQMANEGKRIKIKEVQKGDLLFFKTAKRGKNINHVGLVVEVDDEIKFIHSTTSRGVIVSSLREGYWNSAFIKAQRIL